MVTIGSLSKDLFERRTSTGSEPFFLFICLDADKSVLLSFFSLKKTIYPSVSNKPLPSDTKSPLPVDVRRSRSCCLRSLLFLNFLVRLLIYNNGNRTEWSPNPTRLDATKFFYQLIITITNFVIYQAFLNQNSRNSEIFLLAVKKKPFKCARAMARTVQLLRLDMYCVLLHCPISAEIRTVVGLSDLRNF